MRHDPYDVRIAFDDLYEREQPVSISSFYPVVGGVGTKRATRNVLRKARSKRLFAPIKFAPAAVDTTAESFQLSDRDYEVLGSVDTHGFRTAPVYSAFLQFFRGTRPRSKLVRVDTPASYEQFRDARSNACCDGLNWRLQALESTVARHVSDHHGGGRLASLEAAFAKHLAQHPDDLFEFGDYSRDVLGSHRTTRRRGGNAVPIPVVPALRGKVECWQEGDEICCTVRFKNKRGNLSLVTTATPIQRHLEEALSCASSTELECVWPVLDRLVQILGSTELIPELCRTVPILSTTHATSPMIVVMVAQGTPELAAAMALLQQCQRGDRRTHADIRALYRCGAGGLLEEASNRLTRAQTAKNHSLRGV